MSNRLRAWIPPPLLPAVRRLSPRRIRYGGRPASWQAAQQASTGYDAAQILERVRAATRSVASGQAAYERDGVLFRTAEYSFPLLAALMRAAAARGGALNVVDFGGSLGSMYWQYRPLLDTLRSVRWQVVEQPMFVAAGQAEFANDSLNFVESLDRVRREDGPPLLLAGSVLQYLEDPMSWLTGLRAADWQALVLDRIPVSEAAHHTLCVQTVPSYIYSASYPCWIFSRPALEPALAAWVRRYDYPCDVADYLTENGLRFGYHGQLLEPAPAP